MSNALRIDTDSLAVGAQFDVPTAHRDLVHFVRCTTDLSLSHVIAHALGTTRYDVVVVDGSVGGDAAADLASDLEVPVLLAKPGGLRDVAVVATALDDARYPVLSAALRVLGREVATTVVHNVADGCGDDGSSLPYAQSLGDIRRRQLAELKRHDVGRAGRSLGARLHPWIASRQRTEDAVVEAARGLEAGIVVVGTTSRLGLWRILVKCTAASVADRLMRTTLVVPV